MALREKFGRQVLLEKLSEGALGVVYRAARLGPSGLDRIVTLLRYSEEVSTHPEAAARLMGQARAVARLQIPGLIRAINIGRVEQSYYVAYDLVEGRTLRVVIDRSRKERFPLAVENALMVASRAAAVLQTLHARQDAAGVPLFHGLLRPSHLVVSWEGEVRVAGTGTWPALRDTGLLGSDDGRWLAPEQAAGSVGDPRSDIYALALVVLEALTGWSPDGSDPLGALSTVRLTSVTRDEEPLPAPLEEILHRALAPDPASRYPTMGEMRRAIDALLFSGDFTPTTFNLAFFMHTLFRGDLESEAKVLEEDRRADYSALLPPPRPEPEPAPVPAGAGGGVAPAETLGRNDVPSPDVSDPSSSGLRPRSGPRRPESLPPSESGRMFTDASRPASRRRGLVVLAGVAFTIAVLGGGGYLYSARPRPVDTAPRASTVSPETAAAQARVRELEARVAELEREKAVLEAALAGAGREVAPVASGGLADVDDPEVVPPTLLREGPPVQYPAEARSHGRRALVVVEALVGEDGSVLETRTLESSVSGMGFEEAAQRRAEASLYRPATKRGVPVRVRIRVPVEFTP
jgi:TonB family protein